MPGRIDGEVARISGGRAAGAALFLLFDAVADQAGWSLVVDGGWTIA